MSKKRRNHSAAFKASIALEAIKGEQTLSELSARFGIHPTQIQQWKKQLVDETPTFRPVIRNQAALLYDQGLGNSISLLYRELWVLVLKRILQTVCYSVSFSS
ncbi:MAG: transposase [Dehalococcoidia bacterium]|nr:transposase [Dehalococcoidia bacterium]